MDEALGWWLGGILALIAAIRDHPEAISYDWRNRFGLPLSAIFDERMTWIEAVLLLRALLSDPTSHLYAAVAGWAHPFSHEARILADQHDLLKAVNTDKKHRGRFKPYPRPWESKEAGHRSSKPTVSQDVILAALAARGHPTPPP